MIDLATIISLELIQNLQHAKSKDCLLGVLNETFTPMGSRLLRSNVLQPSTEPTKLLGRYDAVEELGTREDIFHAVREGWLPKISFSARSLNGFQLLKVSLIQIEY